MAKSVRLYLNLIRAHKRAIPTDYNTSISLPFPLLHMPQDQGSLKKHFKLH